MKTLIQNIVCVVLFLGGVYFCVQVGFESQQRVDVETCKNWYSQGTSPRIPAFCDDLNLRINNEY